MDDIEQRQKNPTLLINGLNERHQSENGVLGLAYVILHLKLGYTDLDEVVNLGKNRAEQTVTKVTFTSMWARNIFYKARANLKNTGLNIWINEDLATERLKLPVAVRAQVKGRKIYKMWASLGTIFAKTSETGEPTKIEKVSDIDALLSKKSD